MQNDLFLQAYRIETDGHCKSLKRDEPVDLSQYVDGFTWLHMCAFNPASRDFTENHADLDPIIVDAMLAQETRPRRWLKTMASSSFCGR